MSASRGSVLRLERRALPFNRKNMKTFSSYTFAALLTVFPAMAQVIPGQYIVVLKPGVASADQTARALVGRHGGSLGHVFRHAIQGFSLHGAAAAAEAIEKNPTVAYVEPDLRAHAIVQTLVPGIDRVEADLSPIAAIDGGDERVDVDVAVLDTGIATHPDLPPVFSGKHFYTVSGGKPSGRGSFEDGNYADDNGHGTHVAGTIAALDNDFGVVGVAPGARLWAVKVLDADGSGSFSDVLAGIDYVTANAGQIDLVNMSLGGQGTMSSLRTAIQTPVASGVVFVVAAGNESRDVYGPDGVFGTSDDSIPASYPEVSAVSAMGDTDGVSGGFGPVTSRVTADDTFADFTNFSRSVVPGNPVNSPGAAIDVAGPGVDVLSTYLGGAYATASGTSMASPHVAGLAALEIAANGRAMNAIGVAQIRQALIDAAQPQSEWRPAATLDPDSNPEGLAMAVTGPPNDAPVVELLSPVQDSIFSTGSAVMFSGAASDPEDGDLTAGLQWTSDIDGSIGVGGALSVILSDGTHTITAAVTDSGGKTRSASVRIRVGEAPAEATAVVVSEIAYAREGGRAGNRNLVVTITILDDLGVPVVNASVSIALSRDGQLVGTGTAPTQTNGTVSFTLRNAPAGCYETDVTQVQAGGLGFDGSEPANQFCQ